MIVYWTSLEGRKSLVVEVRIDVVGLKVADRRVDPLRLLYGPPVGRLPDVQDGAAHGCHAQSRSQISLRVYIKIEKAVCEQTEELKL